jgi:hypothetical protein
MITIEQARFNQDLDFFMKVITPWILSCLGILMTYMAGNKHKWAWAIGIASQILWFAYVTYTKQWGFLPMSITLFVIYTRNHFKWIKESAI